MAELTKQDIYRAIEEDRIQLYGQPKWTFGKNTCNTYEVFADLMMTQDSEPILPSIFCRLFRRITLSPKHLELGSLTVLLLTHRK